MKETSLLSLVGGIYDAALDPALWPTVLGKVARFVGGPSAALWSKDCVNKTGNASFWFGFDRGYVRAYLDQYLEFDPAGAAHFLATIGEPIAQTGIISAAELRATRFFREWSRPQGLVDCIQVTLEKSSTSIALFGVSRHLRDGVADADAFRRMRLIVPHIRRAWLVSKAIDLKATQAETLADTLDGLGAGVFLVDARRRIVHTNAAGNVMLSFSELLCAAGGRLVAADSEGNRCLQKALVAASRGDAAVGVTGVALVLAARDGTAYVAHVLPLTSGTRQWAGKAWVAAAAVFVHKAAVDVSSPPEIIARHFKLTPTELRVLLAIVNIGGVPDVADKLGIAYSTVKTHLDHIYDKTGTRRQADLVRLVDGFSFPLSIPRSEDAHRARWP
jgi:DNA-binding CsgD family transcriptional regulator